MIDCKSQEKLRTKHQGYGKRMDREGATLSKERGAQTTKLNARHRAPLTMVGTPSSPKKGAEKHKQADAEKGQQKAEYQNRGSMIKVHE